MSQYNIQPDPQLPSDEEIRAQMDFNEVYSRYTATNAHGRHWWQRLRLTPRLFGGLALALAIGLLVYEAIEEEEQAQKTAKRAEALLAQTPDPAAKKGGIRQVTTHDTVFVQAWLYGGQPLRATVNRPDSQQVVLAWYNPKRNIWEAVSTLRPEAISHPIFQLDVLTSEFPELTAVKDLHWQHVSGMDIDRLATTQWEGIRVERLPNGLYLLVFAKGGLETHLTAKPVSGKGTGVATEYAVSFAARQNGLYQLVPK